MKYEDCKEIIPRPCVAFLVEYEDGEKEICLWHKDAIILEVVYNIKINEAKKRKFTVTIVDVGRFKISSVINSYSSDARKVNEMAYVEI